MAETDNPSDRALLMRGYAEVCKKYGLRTTASSAECMAKEMEPDDRYRLNLTIHDPKVVKMSEEIVEAQVERSIKFLRGRIGMDKDFRVVARKDWCRTRRRSMGGLYSGRYRSFEIKDLNKSGPMISLCMGPHVPPAPGHPSFDKIWHFVEYSSFRNDPAIGTWKGTWQDCLRCLVMHEVSHAVQFNCATSKARYQLETRDKDSSSLAAHQGFWKWLYALQRKEFGFVQK